MNISGRRSLGFRLAAALLSLGPVANVGVSSSDKIMVEMEAERLRKWAA